MVRAQAALEFLMTYGWAFLVMTAVIAAFTAFDPLSIGATEVHRCSSTTPLISCSEDRLMASSVEDTVEITVSNNDRDAKIITNVTATVANESTPCLPRLELRSQAEKDIRCDVDLTGGQRNELDVSYEAYTASVGDEYAKQQSLSVTITPGDHVLPGVLDRVGGARVAYSLESLTEDYTGPVVTVKRSSDAATRDFTATEVQDGTLEAWLDNTDGIVTQLYDQTGGITAGGRGSPKIAKNGSLVTANGEIGIKLNVTDGITRANDVKQENLSSIVHATINGTAGGYNDHGSNQCGYHVFSSGTELRFECQDVYSGDTKHDITITPGERHLYGATAEPNGPTYFKRGQRIHKDDDTYTGAISQNVNVAKPNDVRGFHGSIHTYILYKKRLSPEQHARIYRLLY